MVSITEDSSETFTEFDTLNDRKVLLIFERKFDILGIQIRCPQNWYKDLKTDLKQSFDTNICSGCSSDANTFNLCEILNSLYDCKNSGN